MKKTLNNIFDEANALSSINTAGIMLINDNQYLSVIESIKTEIPKHNITPRCR